MVADLLRIEFLMVLFSAVELGRWCNVCLHLPGHLRHGRPYHGRLLLVVWPYTVHVLTVTDVVVSPGVVGEEPIYQLLVAQYVRVIAHTDALSVISDRLVRRPRRSASAVPTARLRDARNLHELGFRAPKSAERERSGIRLCARSSSQTLIGSAHHDPRCGGR